VVLYQRTIGERVATFSQEEAELSAWKTFFEWEKERHPGRPLSGWVLTRIDYWPVQSSATVVQRDSSGRLHRTDINDYRRRYVWTGRRLPPGRRVAGGDGEPNSGTKK
jgi:hypothetical protein